MRAAHVARLRRLRHRVRQLRQHALRREPRAVRRVLGGDSQGRARRRARRRAALRSGRRRRSWPIGSSKGTCPKCESPDQYGDNCEKCGATYSATDLIEPYSAFSGAKPELRPATHWFIRTEDEHAFLERVDADGRPSAAGRRQLAGVGVSWSSRCAIGTSRGRRRTSASRFPTRRATTGTSGSMRRSATSPARGNGASANGETARRLVEEPETSRFITSSAKTSRTSTRCSGR